ncbi:triosephosphate isomerase [Holotrichia oblita]|nr:triosephosphate isomerase [Holotrichia oblita]
MQKTNADAEVFFNEYKNLITKNSNQVIFCVPYTTLPTAVKYAKKLNFVVGAENVAWAKNGTFTGEISADMLIEAGVKSVIVGHSERRMLFGETLESMNARLKTALNAGLISILCINETLEELEKGTTNKSIQKQLDVCLKDISDVSNLIIAYEPVFAISGGDPTKPKPIPTKEKIESLFTDLLTKLY